MVRTPYWVLERDPGQSFFRLRRTSESVASVADMPDHIEKFRRIFKSVDTKNLGLLMDLRQGPMRNDPKFEKDARPWQQLILKTFGRTVILVGTPGGKLQMERIVAALAPGTPVCTDEATAIAHLR